LQLAKVTGKIVATRKDTRLAGIRLLLVQPLGADLEAIGSPVVACDGLSSREGELVMVVRAREASFAMGEKPVPSDCSIVGRVDTVDG
jgi:ethanolamine utilization protein EutN